MLRLPILYMGSSFVMRFCIYETITAPLYAGIWFGLLGFQEKEDLDGGICTAEVFPLKGYPQSSNCIYNSSSDIVNIFPCIFSGWHKMIFSDGFSHFFFMFISCFLEKGYTKLYYIHLYDILYLMNGDVKFLKSYFNINIVYNILHGRMKGRS